MTPEAPEHSHHSAHTGHRWLDIVLALSAMFVSAISLIVAVEHGRTMERMADANTRMVEASSWPFIQFTTHNVDEHGNPKIRFVLDNVGVGPARIETFELWWNGQAMSSPGALIIACCAVSPEERAETATTARFSVGLVAPSILRAASQTEFFALDRGPGDKDLWSRFNAERDKVTVRVCYCSVFDECWRGSGITNHPQRVAACPKPEVPFEPAF